ncbi:PREDICTED: uncharacterized protein C3orf18-like [Priapulus caudatus]|uniref:Uncharacterized protein C3orf18-like n=1 Tax=Priapulus caudatus TaxID=37621 RepID=A0ABM1EXP0_PRICU|nr:PREDICTED: uncharacterized protein C3orf18-like [Priapulus caudatus]
MALTYICSVVGVLFAIVLLVALVVFMVKKNRIDKLRHHLMPLYNFDPADECEDWESELLEEGRHHGEGIYRAQGMTAKLAFTPDVATGHL